MENSFEAVSTGFILFFIIFAIVLAVIQIILSLKLAKKINYHTPWFAALPIVNYIFYCDIAGISRWFVLAIFGLSVIPFFGAFAVLILYAYIMFKFFEAFNVNSVLYTIIATIVPFGWFIILYILATDDSKNLVNNKNSEE